MSTRNVQDKTEEKVEGKRPLRFQDIVDKRIIVHLIAIVCVTLAAGIVFLHTGWLWVQYMNDRNRRSTIGEFYVTQESASFFHSPSAEQYRDNVHQNREIKLVVNTSMYFWWRKMF